MKTILGIALILLSGCAVTEERAQSMGNADLCEAAFSRMQSQESKNTAQRELASRQFDCRPYFAAKLKSLRSFPQPSPAPIYAIPTHDVQPQSIQSDSPTVTGAFRIATRTSMTMTSSVTGLQVWRCTYLLDGQEFVRVSEGMCPPNLQVR